MLVPSGAHLIEFSNKMKLDPRSYMTVQQIYSGWALAGIPLIGAMAANLWLALRTWRQRIPFLFASAAFLLMLATLISFLVWIYPVNEATAQWTVVPPNLQPLRRQWEVTHAANAVLTFLAVIATVSSSLKWRHSDASR